MKKKSTSSTNSSKKATKKDLTVVDVCEIIKNGSLSGVAELKFRGLHITFQDRNAGYQDLPVYQSPGQATEIAKNSASDFESDKKDYLQDRDVDMDLEDPVGFDKARCQRRQVDMQLSRTDQIGHLGFQIPCRRNKRIHALYGRFDIGQTSSRPLGVVGHRPLERLERL